MIPADNNRKKRKKYRGYRGKFYALVIALVVTVAGFSIYYFIENQRPSGNVLVVYTYPSFMQYGLNNTSALNTVFKTFEKEYNVTIEIKTPSAGVFNALNATRSHPQADIVIGLTNMNGISAVQDGLLIPFASPEDAYINSTLLSEMGSAAQYLTPYEYSYLGIDYNLSYSGNGSFEPSFADLATKANVSNLLMENPVYDDTGLGFLLWEIAYYSYVLHQPDNWTSWWTQVRDNSTGLPNHVYDGWDSAFGAFNQGNGTNLVVSYLTDPIYNVVWGYPPIGSSVTYHNGSAYGWRTIYGIGIVNGSTHLQLDKEFINYFLGSTVQSLIPENEWMYPAANTSSYLPPLYNSTLPDQSSIIPLNNYMNASYVSSNINSWKLEWQAIYS